MFGKGNQNKVQYDIPVPEPMDLDIVYDDQDIAVINKPAGVLVHPLNQKTTGTIANGLMYHYGKLPLFNQYKEQPGLVHRLDRGTSGLLVIAKNSAAMESLAYQFRQHTVQKRYKALVWGVPQSEGTIRINIAKQPGTNKMAFFPKNDQGKYAVTHYKLLQSFDQVSLIECKLETGRTHQIRVHLRSIGHSLFNDFLYGGRRIWHRREDIPDYDVFVKACFRKSEFHMLHAFELGFNHPRTRKPVLFTNELPQAFSSVITDWSKLPKT